MVAARARGLCLGLSFFERERISCGQVADQMQRVMAAARTRPEKVNRGPRLVIFWLFLVVAFTAMWHFLSRQGG